LDQDGDIADFQELLIRTIRTARHHGLTW